MGTQPVRMPQRNTQGKTFSIADVSAKAEVLPNRYALHAREGWGKTSFAAYAQAPVYIQTKGETGLDTLIENGILPETPHFPEIQTWEDLMGALYSLLSEEHAFKTLVIDTINGAERLLYEYVCRTQFGNDWGERGFMGFARGYEMSLSDWRVFLEFLDDLRRKRKMTIFFLIHTKVKTFKNPEGSDYDRWAPDMHEKAWGLTHKWLDCVLFGNFDVAVQGTKNDPTKKGKVSEKTFRVLYTQQHPAFDAKNRMGLPEEIEMGATASESWERFSTVVKAARKKEVANG